MNNEPQVDEINEKNQAPATKADIAELAQMTAKADLKKYVGKKFIDIVRSQEEELIAQHQQYYADPSWIAYWRKCYGRG